MAINKDAIAELLGNKPKDKKKGGNKSEFLWFRIPKEACEVTLRFCPPTEGRDFPGQLTHTHFGIPNPDPKKKWALKINSLTEFLGDKDPMEKVLSKFRNELDVDEFEKVTYTNCNVLIKKIVVDGKVVVKDDDGVAYDPTTPRIFRAWGDFNFYWLLEKCVDEDFGDITDPEEGFDVKFIRKESGGKIERNVLPRSNSLGENAEQTAAIVAKLVDFDKVWRTPDDDYVKRAKEVAGVLEDVLKAKLEVEEANDNMKSEAPAREQEISKHAEEKAEEKKAKKEEAKAGTEDTSIPFGAPECFGKPDKLYAGHESEDAAEEANLEGEAATQFEKCQDCIHESSCAEKLGRD